MRRRSLQGVSPKLTQARVMAVSRKFHSIRIPDVHSIRIVILSVAKDLLFVSVGNPTHRWKYVKKI